MRGGEGERKTGEETREGGGGRGWREERAEARERRVARGERREKKQCVRLCACVLERGGVRGNRQVEGRDGEKKKGGSKGEAGALPSSLPSGFPPLPSPSLSPSSLCPIYPPPPLGLAPCMPNCLPACPDLSIYI